MPMSPAVRRMRVAAQEFLVITRAALMVATFALSFITAVSTVNAQQWYGGGTIGIANILNQSISGSADTRSSAFELDFDPAMMIGAHVGYDFAPIDLVRPRLEGEFIYRDAQVKGLEFNGAAVENSGGIEAYSYMVNALIDLPQFLNIATPYIGVGVGVTDTDYGVAFQNQSIIAGDASFAFQLIGGLEMPINPNLSFYGDLRYFAAPSITATHVANGGNLNIDGSLESVDLAFGFRYRF